MYNCRCGVRVLSIFTVFAVSSLGSIIESLRWLSWRRFWIILPFTALHALYFRRRGLEQLQWEFL
ncbi:hypothetical protein C8F01DRAFT_1146425 [Mycena amicta]|nr:hypothetical protein C8F01DRAFT_1146425 [Mycena amicta]